MQRFVYIILFSLFFVLVGEEPAWEKHLQSYFARCNTPYVTRVRFYTYLYVVQESSADCPSEIENYIVERLANRFFPNSLTLHTCHPDLEQLAESILCPYLARISLEDASFSTFPSHCWRKKIPEANAQIAKWLPWATPIPQPPPPLASSDREGWAQQFAELKKIRQNLTEKQREILKLWLGKHGKEYEWRVLVNLYMEQKNIPHEKELLVRATLMMGIYDGLIAEMHAKYKFCIPRPFMMDPSFKPLTRELQSPSYPSGHAIQGSICGTILSYFFPEDASYWEYLDEEGANTRMWAGVHFPEDIEQGHCLGKKVASQILEKICPHVKKCH